MKLLTLDNKGEKQLGVKVGDVVVNVPNALKEKPKQSVAATMETLIEQGEAGLQALEAYVDEVKSDQATYIWKEQDVDFAAAITRPRKIICVGLNYRKHADETKAKYPEVPVLFNKFDNALTGHLQEIKEPRTTERRSEEHTSELQSRGHLVCRLLLEKKKIAHIKNIL